MQDKMTSMERLNLTMSHQEPDRVPFFLSLTYHGARELDMTIKQYFSRAEHVVEGQLRMLARYRHDGLISSYYSALETEAFGMETLFPEDGPPCSGAPVIRKPEDILKLVPPDVYGTPCLRKVLDTISSLRREAGPGIPIVGAVTAPYSLPIMQMGFEKYLDLMFDEPALFQRLMSVNEEFCVAWGNAQLAAGATALGYGDPMCSPSLIPLSVYERTGFPITRRIVSRIHGPMVMVLASEMCTPVLPHILESGVQGVAVSQRDDIGEIKRRAGRKLTVLGDLSGIEMCRWTRAEMEARIRTLLAKAGKDGGLVITDSAGEIPFQVREATLEELSETVRELGRYPLEETKG